jgi:hypothetical protein
MNKKQKQFYTCLFLLVFSIAISLFAVQPSLPTINGEPVITNFGYKSVATPTINITDSTLVDLNDYLPVGTIGFEIRCKEGAFVVAHEDNIATGSDRVGRLVSAGESLTWNSLAGDFNGVIVANSTDTTVIIDGAWGEYED